MSWRPCVENCGRWAQHASGKCRRCEKGAITAAAMKPLPTTLEVEASRIEKRERLAADRRLPLPEIVPMRTVIAEGREYWLMYSGDMDGPCGTRYAPEPPPSRFNCHGIGSCLGRM